jgi:hypothetical protein
MINKGDFFSLFYLLFAILPIAVLNGRAGKARIFKHVLIWIMVIMALFLVGKALKGTFLPAEHPALPRGALTEDIDHSARHPAVLNSSPE